jgi:hypothetical protein
MSSKKAEAGAGKPPGLKMVIAVDFGEFLPAGQRFEVPDCPILLTPAISPQGTTFSGVAYANTLDVGEL